MLPSFGSSSNGSESLCRTYAEVVKKSLVSKKTLSSSTCESFSEFTDFVKDKGMSYDTVTSKEWKNVTIDLTTGEGDFTAENISPMSEMSLNDLHRSPEMCFKKVNMRQESVSHNKHSKKKSVNSLTSEGYVSTPYAPGKCIKVNPSMPSIK